MTTFGNRRDIRAGILTGATFALVFSIIAAIAFVVKGFASMETRVGLSLTQIVASYFAGGISGGAIVGALLPLARRRWGAPVLGFLGVLPFALAVSASLFPRGEWFPPGAILAALMALLFGAGPAAVVYGERNKHGKHRSSS